MSRWNEGEFVQRAGVIAHDHAISKKSINDLSEKVARDESLQPDEIRTLVRLANVATFQELFRTKDASNGGDKMIEFEAGDAEAVITRIVTAASSEPQTANIENDKLASCWDVPDQMREIRTGVKLEAPTQEKTAAEMDASYVDKPGRQDLAVLALRKLATEFDIERLSAAQRWETQLNKLAAVFNKAPGYGPDLAVFEKDACAEFGMDAQPELKGMRETLRLADVALDPIKVAALKDHHVTEDTRELRMLKEAIEMRQDYQRFVQGLEWINQNMPAMGR